MDDVLKKVKDTLGITGDYQDNTLRCYIEEVQEYMKDAGISEEVVNDKASFGVIARGVCDLWTYGPGNLSNYFMQRVIQLCYKGGKMILEVYKGEDRSHGQSERPFVEFSEALDNLVNTSYQMRTEEYSNVTLIGGEGEGTDRKYASVGNSLKGLERNEIFTDARDISQTTMDETITDEQYKVLLQERGKEKLAELSMTEGFSGEVVSNNTFTYEEDFSMGDIVTVTNKYGISRNARVISTIESESSTGITLIPQFNL